MAGKSGEDKDMPDSVSDVNDELMDPAKILGDTPEPVKPPGPYVLFFRDTVTTITKQNPNVEFDEIKKIVESIWNSLSAEHKLSYENKHQTAKLEYQQDMISYLKAQQNQLVQVSNSNDNKTEQTQIATKPAVFNVNPTPSTSNNTEIQQDDGQKSPTSSEMAALSSDASSGLAIDAATDQPATTSSAVEGSSSDANSARKCLRLGCNNTAVENADWEDEYCNNECVVMHCRTVFNNWVQTNKTS